MIIHFYVLKAWKILEDKEMKTGFSSKKHKID